MHEQLAANHLVLGVDVQEVRRMEDERQVRHTRHVVELFVGAEHGLVLDRDRADARIRRVRLRRNVGRHDREQERPRQRAKREPIHQAVYPPSTRTVEPVT